MGWSELLCSDAAARPTKPRLCSPVQLAPSFGIAEMVLRTVLGVGFADRICSARVVPSSSRFAMHLRPAHYF
jgi:hypothetical protein